MKHPHAWKTLKKKLQKVGAGAVSFRPVTKTVTKAIAYCKKDGEWQDHGTSPGRRGGPRDRTDLLALRDAILAGKTEEQVLQDESTAGAAARYTAYMQRLLNLRQKKEGLSYLRTKHEETELLAWQDEAVTRLDQYDPTHMRE